MGVDADPFPTTTVGMVDAHLPRDKGTGKAKVVSARHIPRKGTKPRLQIDLFSNSPLSTGPAIDEPMSSSGAEETNESATLRTKSKADVRVKPRAQPRQTETPRFRSGPLTPQKTPSSNTRNTVFNRLGPQEIKSSSARRRLDFDTSFYNEEYYSCNSSSSSSSASRRTFKPPKPQDQRWYTYHSSKGVYTALSKSQKRRRQIIDCLARRRAARETSAASSHKWQPKEKVGDNDNR